MPEKPPKTDSPKVRVVADVMSAPALTAEAGETIAVASARMNERKVGSVVVVDGERAIGILTERDLVRFAASGADTRPTKVSEWMTADPDTVGPDVEVGRGVDEPGEHGYRHIPVVDDGELVGIVSMRDLMRIAQIQPVGRLLTDVPRGLKGVVVTETEIGDVRGLEGFYHYRQYSAIDLGEQRPLEDVWHLLFDGELPTLGRAAQSFSPRSGRCASAAGDGRRRCCRAIANAGEHFSPLDGAAHRASRWWRRDGLQARPRHRHEPRAGQRHAHRRGDRRRCSPPSTACATARSPSHPHPDLGYAANYLYMLTGDEPEPERTPAPSSST